MKTTVFTEENGGKEAWLNWRLGKITGSTLRDTVNVRESGIKSGIYRVAAESLIGSAAIQEADLTASQVLERGHRLEREAIARFEKETGKKVKPGIFGWERDDDSRMAVSPDGVIGKTEAIEVKCFLSPKHLEALHGHGIPKNTGGYEEQRIQYFIVNENLKKLHYCFYHPDFPAPLDFLHITFTRKELQPEIDRYLALERDAVAKVREIVNSLTLYSPEEVAAANQVRQELLASNEATVEENIKKITKAVKAAR